MLLDDFKIACSNKILKIAIKLNANFKNLENVSMPCVIRRFSQKDQQTMASSHIKFVRNSNPLYDELQ